MYQYLAFGLQIRSDLPLPNLPPGPGGDDVVLTLGPSSPDAGPPDGMPWSFHVTPRFASLAVAALGTIVVHEGRRIVATLLPGADEGMLVSYLTGSVLAVLLYQRRFLVLHASAVAIRGVAVALMADPGSGKSSLAAALCYRGHELLTDDLAAVDFSSGEPVVIPAFPQLKLSRQASLVLRESSGDWISSSANRPARTGVADLPFAGRPTPLAAVYSIAVGESQSIAPAVPEQCVGDLLRFSYPSRLLQPGNGEHLRQCARLIASRALFRLTRPDDLAQLYRLAEAVEAHALRQGKGVRAQQQAQG